MKTESNEEKKKVLLAVRGHRAEFFVDDTALVLCEDIKNEAKRMLEKMVGAEESEADVGRVNDFLLASIEKLAGIKFLKEIFCGREVLTPELTEVLCSIISEVGAAFEGKK